MRLWIFGKKEKGHEDMGEEEIKTIIEIQKIYISRILWAYLVILTAFVATVIKEGVRWVNEKYPEIAILLFFIAILLGILLRKTQDKCIKLARMLDKLNKSDN
jgi:hypothetical protein